MSRRRSMIRALAVLAGVALAVALDAPASSAANRGAFALVDHTGRAVTDEDFLGRFMLVFFGYTSCPDVCPTDLQVMSNALDVLGAAAERVQPIFITVDPERDTPEVLAGYLDHFHPSLVGLTGTPAQVAAVAKLYRVRYTRLEPEGGDAGEYLIDHTGATYLIGPDGGGLSLYQHGITAEAMAADIRRYLEADR